MEPTSNAAAPGVAASIREAARKRPGLAVFVITYIVVLGVVGALLGAELAIPYVVLVATLLVVVVRLDLRFDFGSPLLWALAVWGLAHMLGGIIPLDDDRVLYNAVLGVDLIRYDRLVHAFGFGAATLACSKVLDGWLPDRRWTAAPIGIVVLAGMGVGAINEVLEFITTLVFEDTNVGGYVNTGWDLVFDLVGATAVGLWLWRHPNVELVAETS
jgi:hypothetical protein